MVQKKKPSLTKTYTGKHCLTLSGEYIHDTQFEIDIAKQGKYTVYLSRKYHFWKSLYTVSIKEIKFVEAK